ncbi:hypothetical protein C447_12672 [Halococcus hamelinensis 100A6]|uniref:Uncharacterized protein n=1 Tax=Halococcus hamelinensis 100A6 TaxID=1132509 RepID=M0LZ08_9EURY|nr:hypothetical protein C447_12672 [Halococcus hamelinensis 100A6]
MGPLFLSKNDAILRSTGLDTHFQILCHFEGFSWSPARCPKFRFSDLQPYINDVDCNPVVGELGDDAVKVMNVLS